MTTGGALHGAHSNARLTPIADALMFEVSEAAPWTGRPAFRWAVEGWAYAEAACVLYRRWYDERGISLPTEMRRGKGNGVEQWQRAERSAARARAELGLDPNSYVRLIKSIAEVGDPSAVARERDALLAEASAAIRDRTALDTAAMPDETPAEPVVCALEAVAPVEPPESAVDGF